jgi:hypothetical protein
VRAASIIRPPWELEISHRNKSPSSIKQTLSWPAFNCQHFQRTSCTMESVSSFPPVRLPHSVWLIRVQGTDAPQQSAYPSLAVLWSLVAYMLSTRAWVGLAGSEGIRANNPRRTFSPKGVQGFVLTTFSCVFYSHVSRSVILVFPLKGPSSNHVLSQALLTIIAPGFASKLFVAFLHEPVLIMFLLGTMYCHSTFQVGHDNFFCSWWAFIMSLYIHHEWAGVAQSV